MKQKQKDYIIIGAGLTIVLLTGGWLLFRKPSFPKHLLSRFDSPDIPGSGKCMDKGLLEKLQKLEKVTGVPIFNLISSGARSPRHNQKVGGVANSSHKIPVCKAVDIKTPTTSIRNKLVVAAKAIGFKRIGIATTFIHLDVDASKKQNVAWGYPAGSRPPINPFV